MAARPYILLRDCERLAILQSMRALLVSALIGLCLGVDAAVYKIVNPDGTVSFSDRPQAGAEELDLGHVQTISSPTPVESAEPVEHDAPPGYDVFEVASPKNDETLRDNGGVVEIRLTIEPRLFRDHTISIFMDGKELGGGGRSPGIILQNVDRGTHVVHATIVGKNSEQVTSTSPITFHLHRTSVLSSP